MTCIKNQSYYKDGFDFNITRFKFPVTVDIRNAVEEKLGGEELTNEKALSIFKRIKIESKICAGLLDNLEIFIQTSAIVSIAAGVTAIILAVLGTAVVAPHFVVILGLVNLVAAVPINLFPLDPKGHHEAAEAYQAQADQASKYIADIECAHGAGKQITFKV
jgi:hypothetical protein